MKTISCIFLLLIAQSYVALCITNEDIKEAMKSFSEMEGIVKSLPAENLVKAMEKTIETIKRLPLGLEGYVFLATTSDENYTKVTGQDLEDRSEKVTKMRAMSKYIETRMEELDSVITSKLIDWKKIDIALPKVRSSIFSLKQSLLMAYKAPWKISHIFITMFKQAYGSRDPVTKQIKELYLRKGNPIDKNMFDKAREYFKNDQSVMQHFTEFYTRLFINALIIDFSYNIFCKKAAENRKVINEWSKEAGRFLDRAREIEQDIKNSWTFQYFTDVDELGKAEVEKNSNNKEIASKIYYFLKKKFPQRKWFVLVHNYVEDDDKDRYYDNCRDYITKIGSKKVIVNSVDAKVKGPKFKLSKIFENISASHGPFAPKDKLARTIYNGLITKMGCDKRLFVGAIEEKAYPEFFAAEGHSYKQTVRMSRHFHLRSKPYTMVVFG